MSEQTFTAAELREVLIECHRFIDQHNQDQGYGFYRPPNPNDFSPDSESCTPEEHAAHKAACEAYDAGAYVRDDWDGWNDDHTIHILKAPWGVGSYTIRDEDAEKLMQRVSKLINQS